MTEHITPELLIAAYANGYFPMGESKDSSEIFWYHPERRGIIPLDDFRVPKSLQKLLKHNPFTITTDTAFREVLHGCAARDSSWINSRIIELYCELYEMGLAHSVECWQGGELAGGLYGVSLCGAFFGESMFSQASSASKVALVHLVRLLKQNGYRLLDTQYVNDHLKQFGVIEIPREEYMELLQQALNVGPQNAFV
jgi:leucyl/phenylalanyl-tRNA--protein transferase